MGDSSRQVADAVGHLSEYYRHLTTVSAGAIVVVGTFAKELGQPAARDGRVFVAILSLGVCVVVSTFMMWVYGVARRETDSGVTDADAKWAYNVATPSMWLSRFLIRFGSLVGPAAFAFGFGLLAWFAADAAGR